jgi:hypothetical protein
MKLLINNSIFSREISGFWRGSMRSSLFWDFTQRVRTGRLETSVEKLPINAAKIPEERKFLYF